MEQGSGGGKQMAEPPRLILAALRQEALPTILAR
jgi:hypothetical protein